MPKCYSTFALLQGPHYSGYAAEQMWVWGEVCRHTREDVCAPRLYAPRGSPIAGTEHREERVGQGAEYQLGEAVARGVPLPHRKWLQHAGATQLSQEPLHGGSACGESQGWREGRFLPEAGIRARRARAGQGAGARERRKRGRWDAEQEAWVGSTGADSWSQRSSVLQPRPRPRTSPASSLKPDPVRSRVTSRVQGEVVCLRRAGGRPDLSLAVL